MVTVQPRELPLLFRVAATLTTPLPVPLVGEVVSQVEHGLLTVQLAPAVAVTLMLVAPPLAAAVQA